MTSSYLNCVFVLYVLFCSVRRLLFVSISFSLRWELLFRLSCVWRGSRCGHNVCPPLPALLRGILFCPRKSWIRFLMRVFLPVSLHATAQSDSIGRQSRGERVSVAGDDGHESDTKESRKNEGMAGKTVPTKRKDCKGSFEEPARFR